MPDREYVTTGLIVKGELRVADRVGLREALAHWEDGPCQLVVTRRPQRTLLQNAYLHAVPFTLLAEHTGYTIPEIKLVLMAECFGWHTDRISGREIPIKPSTAEMTKTEADYFIDWLIPWAAERFPEVAIPLPNERMPAGYGHAV